MKLFFTLLTLLFAFSGNAQLDIETSNASVGFTYLSDNTKGSLSGVKATISINPTNLASSTIKGSVEVATLSTNNKMRDKHLKSDDFFDAETYPKMTFESSSLTKNTEGYTTKGKLTIKETTKEVEFTVTEADSHLYFNTMIYGADFGVAVKKDREKSKIEISVSVPLNL